ncbi:MAG: preprotein translocase subunit SecY [Parcubacteria group bacterium CG23_combo_of_CG06-09_8_20_14_all_35_9]|nr:MAG: preprotein translocase subunit SecY [Parcubacteria group bacterium CG23_combo_of_CG06-09_8_20_14_all_35_9]
MFAKLIQIWKIKDLRKSILFVLAILIVFRITAHIPIPGVNLESLRKFFESNEILGLMNIFSGGGMSNFSVAMLGLGPYITASIIFQLLTMIIPSLEELAKEGETGYQKINQYTRLLTVPLAALQAYGMISLLRASSQTIIVQMGSLELLTAVITITAGSIFLMWIGELITEKKIGNGISLLIFAGIVAVIPESLQRAIILFDPSQITSFVTFAAIAIITVVGIVAVAEAQRHILVSYARRVRGTRMYGGMNTYLPIKVNQAGMIPIIFAISIIMFPPMVAQFFMQAKSMWITLASRFVIDVFQNQLFYGIIYFLLVVAFTYFYTFIVFHPDRIAENLQKQGGFIPGIRPGRPTARYLNMVTNRIVLTGALFLGLVAILPLLMRAVTGTQMLAISGASLLIVVGVVIETVKQIESQLTMRDYEGF